MLSATRLVGRLAWRNVRRRPWQGLLLLTALSLSATTLSLALAVRQTGDRGWDQVWHATNGGHVYAALYVPDRPTPDPAALAQTQRRVADLTRAAGVEAGPQCPSPNGPPEVPAITAWQVVIVLGALGAVVVLASVRPAVRGVRQSTIRSLGAPVRPPRRASRLAAALERVGVPTPLVLGLRSALRRPARTVMNAAGLALTVALVIAALALDDGVDRFLATRTPAETAGQATEQALIDQLLTIVYTGAALLIVLAAVNAVVVAVFAARDSARNHAILQSVGATPRQTGTAFLVAQLGACVLGCAAGIPLGVALFNSVAGESLPPVRLSPLTYGAIAVAAILVYALIVVVPARRLAAQPVAPRLAYE